jgi:CubicO group peptidase (beta-lactamase class C family)
MTRVPYAPALALVLTAASTAAQSVDSIFAPYDNRQSPGCAVSAIDGDRTVLLKGFGMASLEHDLLITPQSAFYAASVSKQFTAFAVALLAQQGKFTLDDDVRKWLPEVPNFGKTITVRHLIHHTSGLRDYFGLLGMTSWPGDGPVTEAQFLDLVSRQKALNFDPGTRHLYSNTGYVLLSILVKRVSGQSLRDYAEASIFKPLGMNNSAFRDDHTRLVKNRALAYSRGTDGTWRINVPGFDVVGDGGLYTTVEDLARWGRNFDEWTVGKDIANTIFTRGRLNGGDSIAYAFGLSRNVFRGQPTIEHGGAYGGYRAHLLRLPEQRFTVALLCNAANANPAGLAQRVAVALLGTRLPAVTVSTPANGQPDDRVHVTREQITPFAGAYWDAKSEQMRRFEVRDTALAMVASGLTLVPLSTNQFRNVAGGVTLVFTRTGNSVQVEEMLPTGEKNVYQRMPAARTDSQTLASYAGEYYSSEIAFSWRVESKDGKLLLRIGSRDPLTMEPVFADAFQTPVGIVRFQRAGGRMTGFKVGAGRVTGFQFNKR